MEPSQLGSLKGLNGTKDMGVYTGSAPSGEGKGLIQFEVVLLMSRLPGSESAFPSFRSVVSRPEPPSGHPFIYTG